MPSLNQFLCKLSQRLCFEIKSLCHLCQPSSTNYTGLCEMKSQASGSHKTRLLKRALVARNPNSANAPILLSQATIHRKPLATPSPFMNFPATPLFSPTPRRWSIFPGVPGREAPPRVLLTAARAARCIPACSSPSCSMRRVLAAATAAGADAHLSGYFFFPGGVGEG